MIHSPTALHLRPPHLLRPLCLVGMALLCNAASPALAQAIVSPGLNVDPEFVAAGFAACLTKPVKPASLRAFLAAQQRRVGPDRIV